MDLFFEWLSAMTFSGGEFCDVAIAEGLAEVIAILPPTAYNGHCILVAANNPHPLPTPVYPPSDMSEVDFESRLADAQTVATSFPECSVSLSVICPMTLPKLKTIYNTGKRNPSAADHTIDIVKNPRYLVLISEDFVEACTDLSQSGITKMEVASVSAVSETTSVSPVNESSESTKVDPISVSSPASAPRVEHIPPVSCATSQGVSSLQTSAHSHEIISRNDATETVSRRLMPPPPPPRTSHDEVQSQSSHSTFLKIWEGDLFGGLGNRHFISRLEGYQISTSSDLLAEDWPKTMLIDRLIPKDFMTNNPHADKAESLVFRSMDQTDTFDNYQEKKLGSMYSRSSCRSTRKRASSIYSQIYRCVQR